MRLLVSLVLDLVLTVPVLAGALVLGGALPAGAQGWWLDRPSLRDPIAEELQRLMRPDPVPPGVGGAIRPPEPAGTRPLDEALRQMFRDPSAPDPWGAARAREEAARAEAERRRAEAERQAEERRRREAERQEAERRRQEAARAEAERRRLEAERQAEERRRAAAERAEAARREAERREQEAAARAEAERRAQEEARNRQARLLDEVAGALAGVRPRTTQ